MTQAGELLAWAERFAHEPRPSQATLRLAVSTAYRALFLLLRADATRGLIPPRHPNAAELRRTLSRTFEHRVMYNAARAFAGQGKNAWAAAAGEVPRDLARVAEAFVQLHQARELADYDQLGPSFTRSETVARVRLAAEAFRGWAVVRKTPAARVFLLALLVRAVER